MGKTDGKKLKNLKDGSDLMVVIGSDVSATLSQTELPYAERPEFWGAVEEIFNDRNVHEWLHALIVQAKDQGIIAVAKADRKDKPAEVIPMPEPAPAPESPK